MYVEESVRGAKDGKTDVNVNVLKMSCVILHGRMTWF